VVRADELDARGIIRSNCSGVASDNGIDPFKEVGETTTHRRERTRRGTVKPQGTVKTLFHLCGVGPERAV